MNLVESSRGLPFFRSYSYNDGNSTILFKNIKDGLFVAQSKSEREAVYKFVYAKFFPSSVALYVANVMTNSAPIDNLVREADIRVNASNPERIRLYGDARKQLDFLQRHNLSLLAVIADCSKG